MNIPCILWSNMDECWGYIHGFFYGVYMPGFSELILLSERLRDELFQASGARLGATCNAGALRVGRWKPNYTGWEGADLKGIQDQRYNQDDIPISLIYLTIKICIWICISYLISVPFFWLLETPSCRCRAFEKIRTEEPCVCGKTVAIVKVSYCRVQAAMINTLYTISTPQWKILASRFCLQSYSLI